MSDDFYVLQITGNQGSYVIAAAFEVDDDELEPEDDFVSGSGKSVVFEDAPLVPGFQVTVVEVESDETEEKTYELLDWPAFLGAEQEDFYLFKEISEVKTGTDGDDDFTGFQDDEDYYLGGEGSDRIDLLGVKGKASGYYYDHIVGGEDEDDCVIGRAKSYYDDRNSRLLETFVFLEDFQFNDRVLFLKGSVKVSRYRMLEVSELFARKLEQAGLAGVEQVLVAKNDKKDMLAAFDYENDSTSMTVQDVLS